MIKIIPYNTEKTNNLASLGYVAFKVPSNANKIDIKNAIKYLYDLDVVEVKIINTFPKKKYSRYGIVEKKSSFKKAYVKFKDNVKFDPLKFVK